MFKFLKTYYNDIHFTNLNFNTNTKIDSTIIRPKPDFILLFTNLFAYLTHFLLPSALFSLLEPRLNVF